jgi:hypothetical protein
MSGVKFTVLDQKNITHRLQLTFPNKMTTGTIREFSILKISFSGAKDYQGLGIVKKVIIDDNTTIRLIVDLNIISPLDNKTN